MTYAILAGKHRYRLDREVCRSLSDSPREGILIGLGIGAMLVVALTGLGSIAYQANGLVALVSIVGQNSTSQP